MMTQTTGPAVLQTQKTFLVKERVGVLKLTDTFDIFDPQTGAQIALATEQISTVAKLARIFINKRFLPTTLVVRHQNGVGDVWMSLRRGASLLRADVVVSDSTGAEIGRLRSRVLSVGGGFHVFDPQNRQVANVRGDWKGWNFKFVAADGHELGTVTKKWAGIGKELFSSADNYMIALNEESRLPTDAGMLLVAAGLAIDSVYKEK